MESRIIIASGSLHAIINKVRKNSGYRRCPELEIMGRVTNKASNRSRCKFI